MCIWLIIVMCLLILGIILVCLEGKGCVIYFYFYFFIIKCRNSYGKVMRFEIIIVMIVVNVCLRFGFDLNFIFIIF